VTGDGQHELLYRATDKAGNAETLKSAVLRIDGSKPTLLVAGLAHGQLYGDSQDVRVSWQAVDPSSGIQSTAATLDGQAYTNGALLALYELPLGLHDLTATAIDKAGNRTTTTVQFFVATSFRDMQNLLDRFKATSRLSAKGHKQLSAKLDVVRAAEAAGKDEKAIKELKAFKTLAGDTKLVTDADVRDTLLRDADAMIVRLGGTAGSSGAKAANGWLKGDPTRKPPPNRSR
jgi:hypothetical protein